MTRKRATRAAAWIAVAGVLSALTASAASAAETAVGLTNANPSALVDADWAEEHLSDPNVRFVEVDVDTGRKRMLIRDARIGDAPPGNH